MFDLGRGRGAGGQEKNIDEKKLFHWWIILANITGQEQLERERLLQKDEGQVNGLAVRIKDFAEILA